MADKSKKTICLFHYDNAYKVDVVEAMLMEMNKKYGFNFAIEKHNFALQRMADYCKTKIPQIQVDCAIFVLQAHESRLSINEDNREFKIRDATASRTRWLIKDWD